MRCVRIQSQTSELERDSKIVEQASRRASAASVTEGALRRRRGKQGEGCRRIDVQEPASRTHLRGNPSDALRERREEERI